MVLLPPFITILIRWQWDANSSPSVWKAHVRLQSIYFSSSCFRKMGSQSWLVRWPGWGLLVRWKEGGSVPMLSVVQYMSPSVLRNLALHVLCLLPVAIVRILENVQGLLVSKWSLCVSLSRAVESIVIVCGQAWITAFLLFNALSWPSPGDLGSSAFCSDQPSAH